MLIVFPKQTFGLLDWRTQVEAKGPILLLMAKAATFAQGPAAAFHHKTGRFLAQLFTLESKRVALDPWCPQ